MSWSVRKNPPPEEPPDRKPRGRPRDKKADLAIVNMAIGDSIEVDVQPPAVYARLRRLKQIHGWERKHHVRKWSEYMTRVWRTA